MSQSRFAHALPVSLASVSMLVALAPQGRAQRQMLSDSSLLALDDVEITPDQHFAVVRQNRYDQFALVYDLTTGTLVASPAANPLDGLLGECVDAVALTNTRAIVLGNRAQILDLTNLASPVLTSTQVGYHPRDVAITPDGTLACVRGGASLGAFVGGQYIFDLATGNQVGFHPGEPTPYPAGPGFSFEVDDVALTNDHALMTSFIPNGSAAPKTRVTIWELHPAGGGAPIVAFETSSSGANLDQSGAPYDLAITPDGTKAVVRSELAVGLYDLSVSPPALLWQHAPAGNPGFYNEEALDAVEVTNDRILVLSRYANPLGVTGAQVDVFEMNGTDHHEYLRGSPHDLAITPNGQRAVVRTSKCVSLYDLVNLPAGPRLTALSKELAPSSSTQYFGGLDSVALTDRFAVTLSRALNHVDTQVHFWDISGPDLVQIAMRTITSTRPIDLAITPDGSKVAVTGNSNVTVYELATGVQLFSHYPSPTNAYYPWCDGVAVSNGRVVATCQWGDQNGWIDIVDIAAFASNYCVGAPNSVGPGARISSDGTQSVVANDLKLFVRDAPPEVTALFYYGASTTQTPFGNGFQCIAGSLHSIAPLRLNASGAGWLGVDYTLLPPSGQITPGSTWYFQCEYRDSAAGGAQINTSDALSIVFTP
jgi:DNA-binding beta-propeller fold protein YncE